MSSSRASSYPTVRALDFSDMMLLDEPKIRDKTYGTRTFIFSAPHELNKLPLFIRIGINLSTQT